MLVANLEFRPRLACSRCAGGLARDDQVLFGDAEFDRDPRENAAAARVTHSERAALIHLPRLVTPISSHVDTDDDRCLLLREVQPEASFGEQTSVERQRHGLAAQLIASGSRAKSSLPGSARFCPVLPGLALSPL